MPLTHRFNLQLPVEYDPEQTSPEEIARVVEHSTVGEALVTIMDNMGDCEAVSFGAFEVEEG